MEASFNVSALRRDFPILSQQVCGRDLVYLDSGATTQVPDPVLDAVCAHYRADNANVHRAPHELANRSTRKLEEARRTVARFINAPTSEQVVFTHGTTESCNMVAGAAESLGGGSFAVTALEHHANFVPWQQAAHRAGTEFFVCPLDEYGDVDLAALEARLELGGVGIVATTLVSNVLGTVVPVRRIADMAHAHGALLFVDAAQAMRHGLVDVVELDCDFLAFSGHKTMGPTGIGVLYGKPEALERMEPWGFGGEMVDVVASVETTFAAPPLKFEPGTPNYVGAVGLAAAIRYLESIGLEAIARYEDDLLALAEQRIGGIDGVSVVGHPERRAGCLSFVVEGAHPYDVAVMLDRLGVAVRSGNQCAQPLLHETLGLQNVVRVSPAFYNTPEEIEVCAQALERVIGVLGAARRQY